MISTPGGRAVTKQMAMHTPLNLAGKIYRPSLIVLDGQGLDIIMGMGWMKAHKALLDTAARVVHLDYRHPLLQPLQFIILPLRTEKTFLLPTSFRMSLLKTCQTCLQIGI
jgi:hypothetical protein